MPRFEVRDERFVELRGSHGELLLSSAELATPLACRLAIVSIRLSALLDDRYECRPAPGGGMRFVLKGHNDSVLATSPEYASAESCEAAMAAVRAEAAEAEVAHLGGKTAAPSRGSSAFPTAEE